MTTTTNPVATDLKNAVSGHFIGEKISDLVDAQVFRLISNKIFQKEAEYIKETCQRENIKKIVDFGCWAGTLAEEVFLTGLPIENYHLVDAVPFYLDRAVDTLAGKPITHQAVTLLPLSYKAAAPTSMLVHPYDTLNSSSIYSSYFLKEEVKQANVRVPLAASQRCDEYIKANPELFKSDRYVKIDLDGVDIEFVAEIIKSGFLPGAVHFEVWNNFKGGYTKVSQALKNLGYKIPEPNLHIHQTFSVGIAKNYWWAVGYDNLTTNFRVTYYDQDHGEQPLVF